ncbi:MAG: DUF308 domain-containing protein [Muribaculaceae bacterium]|nr:DUF308 domain-containing protein [Muribaculaceae bacterium]
MKNSASILTNFILIALGVIMICINNHPHIDHTIVKIIGSAFFIAGVINVFIMIHQGSKHKGSPFTRLSGWVSGIGGGLIGLAMFFNPPFFAAVLVYLFGLILVLGGIFQICLMVWGYKNARLSGGLYIIPVVLIVGGIVMMCSNSLLINVSLMITITGIGMIAFGLNSFFAMATASAAKRNINDSENHEHSADKETKQIEKTGEESSEKPAE